MALNGWHLIWVILLFGVPVIATLVGEWYDKIRYRKELLERMAQGIAPFERCGKRIGDELTCGLALHHFGKHIDIDGDL